MVRGKLGRAVGRKPQETMQNNNGIAFVAGSTGFVGKALVRQLAAAGWVTHAHVRPDSPQLADWTEQFGVLGAQISAVPWQRQSMSAELAKLQVTHVFCCLGTTRSRMSRDGAVANSYEAVDFGLPKLLAEASAATATVVRYVYLSSVGAGPNARGAYLQWRWKAEQAVRSSGVAWTIARPSIIRGERGEPRLGEHLAGKVADSALKVLGALGAATLRDRYKSTDDGTLARALLRLATDPEAAGATVESEGLH